MVSARMKKPWSLSYGHSLLSANTMDGDGVGVQPECLVRPTEGTQDERKASEIRPLTHILEVV